MAVTGGKSQDRPCCWGGVPRSWDDPLRGAAHFYEQKGRKESTGLTSQAIVASLARQCDSGDHLTGPSAKCEGVPADLPQDVIVCLSHFPSASLCRRARTAEGQLVLWGRRFYPLIALF